MLSIIEKIRSMIPVCRPIALLGVVVSMGLGMSTSFTVNARDGLYITNGQNIPPTTWPNVVALRRQYQDGANPALVWNRTLVREPLSVPLN